MQTPPEFVIAFVTAPDLEAARKVSRAALEARAAACANIVPAIESHYWWQGELETSGEALIIFKTTVIESDRLREIVLANHPYETPEFITTSIASGSQPYLNWIGDSVKRTG